MIEKHFVTFFSPGTFVSETTEKEIDSWDIEKAIAMSRNISERHGAKPYGFQFTTRANDGELDSKETNRSCMYFLGGEVFTLKQIKARNDPSDKILVMNMEGNRYARVVFNCNSYASCFPLNDGDVVLDLKSEIRHERTER
jgi:hypothetical protein